MRRLFLGVAPSDAQRLQLLGIQGSLGHSQDELTINRLGRRVIPSNFHMTLAFLGRASERSFKQLLIELEQLDICHNWPQFTITLDELTLWRKPKVLCLTGRAITTHSQGHSDIQALGFAAYQSLCLANALQQGDFEHEVNNELDNEVNSDGGDNNPAQQLKLQRGDNADEANEFHFVPHITLFRRAKVLPVTSLALLNNHPEPIILRANQLHLYQSISQPNIAGSHQELNQQSNHEPIASELSRSEPSHFTGVEYRILRTWTLAAGS